MANMTERSSWASIADEFSRFPELYPLKEGQLPLSIHYFPIGFDHGDRSSRWDIGNGSGESARREFQDMVATKRGARSAGLSIRMPGCDGATCSSRKRPGMKFTNKTSVEPVIPSDGKCT
jgi:hypothetical protein